MDEAEDVADPEYREQRAELKEIDEARLAEHNAAQHTFVVKETGTPENLNVYVGTTRLCLIAFKGGAWVVLGAGVEDMRRLGYSGLGAVKAALKTLLAGLPPPIQDFVAGPSMLRTPDAPMTESKTESLVDDAAAERRAEEWRKTGKQAEANVREQARSQDDRILDAMRTWTGAVNKKGRPLPKELSAALGFAVTRQRRNALWLTLKEGN